MKRIYATYIPSRGDWITMQEYSIVWGDSFEITIPKHYSTDLGTIPKIFWWFVNPFEIGVTSTIVHDMAYDLRVGRKFADDIFLEMMKEEGVPARKRFPAYFAVRCFGWTIYYGWTTKFKKMIGLKNG